MTVESASPSASPNDRLFSRSTHDELLRSTVRLARLVFNAPAASIFLYDESAHELIFEASSGAGEDRLIGMTIPADQGIAGWVLATGETVVVRDTSSDERFDRAFAESTGYLPDVIMAAPLVLDESPLGVIEVLDPQVETFGDLSAIDVLTELGNQSCCALSLLRAARQLQPAGRDRVVDEALGRLGMLARGSARDDLRAASDLVVALARMLER
jgi:GAF domain-containing protein